MAAVAAIDKELQRRTNGKLRGRWYRPQIPRRFRVANGEVVPAKYEVEFTIPLRKNRNHRSMVFKVAAIDPGKDPKKHVPWLLSNETGCLLGAHTSSRTGEVWCEDELVKGWTVKMRKSKSGHWLFPFVQGMVDLATPHQGSRTVGFETEEKESHHGEENDFVGAAKVSGGQKEPELETQVKDQDLAEPKEEIPDNTEPVPCVEEKQAADRDDPESSSERLTSFGEECKGCEDPLCSTFSAAAVKQHAETRAKRSTDRINDTFAKRNENVPFSQKRIPEKENKNYPHGFHDKLPQPTDLTVVLWDEKGNRFSRQYRQVKTIPKTWEGAPSKWVRKYVINSLDGEVICDHYESVDGAECCTVNVTLLFEVF